MTAPVKSSYAIEQELEDAIDYLSQMPPALVYEAILVLKRKGREVAVIRPYIEFLERLKENEGGRVTPYDNEDIDIVQRRLILAAELVERELILYQEGNSIYFLAEKEGVEKPKVVGKNPKTSIESHIPGASSQRPLYSRVGSWKYQCNIRRGHRTFP